MLLSVLVSYIFHSLLLWGNINCVKVEDFTTIEVETPFQGKSCLYVSNDPLWPYKYGDFDVNYPQDNCEELGLELAKNLNPYEGTALQELTRCKMSDKISEDDPVLVGAQGAPGKKCYFQHYNGTYSSNDGALNCDSGYDPADGEDNHDKVHYACYKRSACDKIPNCIENPANPLTCFYKDDLNGAGTFDEALTECNKMLGYLPRPVIKLQAEKLWETMGGGAPIWTGLVTEENPRSNCDSVAACLQNTDDKWKWLGTEYDGKKYKKDEPLKPINAQGLKYLTIQNGDTDFCVYQQNENFKSAGCSATLTKVCVLTYGGKGIGSTIVIPEYKSGTITCGTQSAPYPTAPTSAKMAIDSPDNQPVLMCPGESARFTCNAGGINALKDDPKKNYYEVKCKDNQQYATPSTWPECVDKLDCSVPPLDNGVMTYDWDSSSTGVTPPFTVEYACKFPNKKIVKKSELKAGNSNNLADTLTTTCQVNGTYDVNVEDYDCTKPCPFPSLSEPDIMKHDWTSNTTKPEIHQEITHKCLFGKKLVSKNAFQTGADTTLIDEMMSMCTLSGWLNETIGAYTCTKDCKAPTNYSEIFTYNWSDDSEGSGEGSGDGGAEDDEPVVVEIGTIVKYRCNNPLKKVVDLTIEGAELHSVLDVECLYNGQWNYNILEHGCTECLRRNNPPNGRLQCESARYEVNSRCYLVCDPGYLPLGMTQTTCVFKDDINDYDWDVEAANFVCIPPISLLIGGQDSTLNYINDVEVFAPGYSCSYKMLTPYPHKVKGTVSGFLMGSAIVCGGGEMIYVDCTKHNEGSKQCDRNYECVETTGGSQWCTGPKTDLCYAYDSISKDWNQVLKLKTARALASGLVTTTGQFYITGGFGKKSILKSVEVLSFNGVKWSIKRGVKMPEPLAGHCMAEISPTKFIVAGGFSSKLDDYISTLYIFDQDAGTWLTRPWMSFTYGPRYDHGCMAILKDDEKYILTVGGWNNSAMAVSELYSVKDERWSPVKYNTSNVNSDGEPIYKEAINKGFRSPRITAINDKPFIAGGVECEGGPSEKQICERTDKVYRFAFTNENTDDLYVGGKWIEHSSKLSQPKSSHDLLNVPKTMAGCT